MNKPFGIGIPTFNRWDLLRASIEKYVVDFPNVEIFFIKNKNYEYGAWKYALSIYPNYDIYFCIQDSIIVKKK